MSKRLGNTIDPFQVIDKYGADATRWYMISNSNPWDNLKFDLEGVEEVQRKFFGTLFNTYSFLSLYANIDGFKNEENPISLMERSELDQWILSELNSLIAMVDSFYQDYEPTKAARSISDFVQEKLSNWYIRLCRRRFWKGNYEKDKIAAYQTLYECLFIISKLIAPIAPFFADYLYKNLTKNTFSEKFESVHLSGFPSSRKEFINIRLESQINTARNITSLALSLRKKEQIKVRQPLETLMIAVNSMEEKEEIEMIKSQVATEVNVKKIELINDKSDILVKEIKPNFKTLGPKYGREMSSVISIINAFSATEIKTLEDEGEISIKLNEKNIILELSEVEISSKDIEGWLVAHGNGLTVALDISLTEDLLDEGVARELVNRIQNIRKDNGLEVTDRINICFLEDKSLKEKINKNSEYICSETLGEKISFIKKMESGTEVVFDDIKTRITIKKI
jgi:isoleucyl-tRNA synthetase